MKRVVKRRELTNPGQLQALVVEHADSIEPGLTVIDSRLLLGQATIEVVGLDAHGALVLMAVGSVADEDMLLRAVEAYSWCLEYPEAISRLYPSIHVSNSQPPRLIFVVERMPDSFHRKIKQLGFPEVDCVEFRHLDVDGTPAVYFDSLARLRRGPATVAPTPERIVPPPPPLPNGRPTSLKLQRLLGADRPAPGREPAQIVSLLHRTPARAETSTAVGSAPALKLEIAVAPQMVDEPVGRPVDEPETPPVALTEVEAPATSIAIAQLDPDAASVTAVDPASPPITAAEPLGATSAAVDMLYATPEPEGDGTVDDVTPMATPESIAVAPDAALVADIPELEPIVETMTAPEPVDADVVTSEDFSTAEPWAVDAPGPLVVTPEPELALQGTVESPPSPNLGAPSDLEPMIGADCVATATLEPAAHEDTAPTIQAVAPVATPVPSVFARRPAEPVVTSAELKVSFANAAKELLSVTNPTPRSEPSFMPERPSVEEMTRATLDNLVGPSEKPAGPAEERVTAFSKRGGVFPKPAAQNRPRTIAPPPADPQPIAAGPKLGTVPKPAAPPTPVIAPEPTPAPAAEPEISQAPPQGFEGLHLPNDGVLTRQWMEFLNQMAAGK